MRQANWSQIFPAGILIFSLLWACSVSGQVKQPALIAEVLAGQRQEAYVSWWGYDSVDSTAILQAAIDSKVPRLIVDRVENAPWITQPLQLVSNQEVLFAEGVELQALRGAYKGIRDSMLNAINVENVTLLGQGKGATLRMFKADYHTDAYQKAEWRHGIQLLGTKNVRIENLSVVESGGDGVYVGVYRGTDGTRFCTDTVIRKVICDGNNRQGISVIAAINLLIEDTILRNTRGTAPQAGIDFEPNNGNEPLVNCVMRNCVTENNASHGYDFYLPVMDTKKHGPISITLENCVSRNDGNCAFTFTTTSVKRPDRVMSGMVKVINCIFEESGSVGVSVNTRTTDEMVVKFENLTIRDCGRNSVSPIKIVSGNHGEGDLLLGQIIFDNVVLQETLERPMLNYYDTTMKGYYPNHLAGNITLLRNGKKEKQELTQEWLQKSFPPRIEKWVPTVELQYDKLKTQQKITDSQQLKNIYFRRGGEFLLYAQKNDPIEITAAYGQLAKLSGKTEKVTLTTPGGQQLDWGEINFREEKTFSLPSAPETGIYRLLLPCGNNWIAIRKSRQAFAKPGTIDLVNTVGDLYFQVPANTAEFAVHFWGEGEEGCKAAVFAPDGTKAWESDNIRDVEQFLATPAQAAQNGTWRIRLDRASNAHFEDFHLELFGVPSLVSPTPEMVIGVE